MHCFKISGTRGIAHNSNYYNDIYSGSSFNRKANKVLQKTAAETGACVVNEYGVYEDGDDYNSRQIALGSREIERVLSDRGELPLSAVPVQRLHSLSGRSKDKIKNKIQS